MQKEEEALTDNGGGQETGSVRETEGAVEDTGVHAEVQENVGRMRAREEGEVVLGVGGESKESG